MFFQGKRIGIASAAAQLGNTVVLKEIERMLIGGAELSIIIMDPEPNKQDTDNPLKVLLRQLATSCEEEKAQLGSSIFFSSEGRNTKDHTYLSNFPLDLLVLISGFPGLLEPLAQLTAEDCIAPLVLLLIPSPGERPAFPQLSSLMNKDGIFFVPFGPLSSNRDKGGGPPLFCSRIDLLGEACSAALQGNQLCPFIWDNHQFPH